ncbi:MAG: hypothetical protein JO033_27765 [Acidobacteriaceae bacterium]|nr:hypothetical protein [Acidobacteriaceae bacterium]
MKRFLASFLVAGALWTQTAVSFAQKSAPAASPDDRISDQVRMKLATDPDVKGGALDVTV